MNTLFDKRAITIAIMTAASCGNIVQGAQWSVQCLKYFILSFRGSWFPWKTTLRRDLREKSILKELTSTFTLSDGTVIKPRFENIQEMEGDRDDLEIGRTAAKYLNNETRDFCSIKFQLIYKKNDRFGDLFIFNNVDTGKRECVFVRGENKDSVLVNILDYSEFVRVFELEFKEFMDKVVWTTEMLFYPILLGFFAITIGILNILVK